MDNGHGKCRLSTLTTDGIGEPKWRGTTELPQRKTGMNSLKIPLEKRENRLSAKLMNRHEETSNHYIHTNQRKIRMFETLRRDELPKLRSKSRRNRASSAPDLPMRDANHAAVGMARAHRGAASGLSTASHPGLRKKQCRVKTRTITQVRIAALHDFAAEPAFANPESVSSESLPPTYR